MTIAPPAPPDARTTAAIGFAVAVSRDLATRLSRPSDEDLLEAVALGDVAAFADLHARTTVRLTAIVRGLLRDVHQSEEVVQDVFLEVWLKAREFDRTRGRASAWMGVLARRRAVDRIRLVEQTRARDLRAGILEFEPFDWTPFERADTVLDRTAVVRAVGMLTETQREAVLLRYWRGMTDLEVAHHLRVPLGTAKTRLHDALRALRREFHKQAAPTGRSAAEFSRAA